MTDGNEKCYRQRCISDIGEIKLGNTTIHTGCNASPVRGSYFCKNHFDHGDSVSDFEKDERLIISKI